MNINKIMSWINVGAILMALLCWLSLNQLSQANKSYIDGSILFAFLGGPFFINYFLIPKILLPQQKMTIVSLFLLMLMGGMAIICQGVIYTDQLNTSRGFGMLVCTMMYVIIFLPTWIAFLVILGILKRKT